MSRGISGRGGWRGVWRAWRGWSAVRDGAIVALGLRRLVPSVFATSNLTS